MSRSFIQKLWNASPALLMQAARKRFQGSQSIAWHQVQNGPLKSRQIRLPGTNGAWGEMIAGTFDGFIYDEIERIGGVRNKVVWDVGAHFGYHSLSFAQLGATVASFEPNAANRAVLDQNLTRNTDLNQNIRTFPIALSNEDGQTTFFASDSIEGSSSGSHLAKAQTPYSEETVAQFDRITVQTARADTILRTEKLSPPDVMKIDVEGAEGLVLEGATTILSTKKPLLLVEVHHICVMHELRNILDRFGYKIDIMDRSNATASRCFIRAV